MRVRGEEKRRRRGLTPSRRVDAATDLHGDTRRAGRESAGTVLLDWAIALLWPALAPCRAIFPASVTTVQLMDPDPSGVDDEVDHTAPVRPRPHDDRIGGGVAAPRAVERIHIVEIGRASCRERVGQYV